MNVRGTSGGYRDKIYGLCVFIVAVALLLPVWRMGIGEHYAEL